MSDKPPVRIAQYGVMHAHASGHARALNDSAEVDFCGVYEPSAEARHRAGSNAAYEGVRWFASKEEMLEDDSIAAVAIEGAVDQLLPFAREAVEHGKHIWLDKPAGDDLDEFGRILDIARNKGLLVQLGYMFRYNDAFQRVLALAKNGALGDVFAVRGRMSTSANEETREKLGKFEGGILFELLCHLIDVVVELLGRPTRVTSFLRNDLGITPDFADNALTVFEYDNAMATLSSAAMEVEPFPCRRFEAIGTKGTAIIEPLEPPSMRLCMAEATGDDEKGWRAVEVEKRPRYVHDVIALVADIRGTKNPDRSLDDELLVQETVLRASRNSG